jgi:hypothetical protein
MQVHTAADWHAAQALERDHNTTGVTVAEDVSGVPESFPGCEHQAGFNILKFGTVFGSYVGVPGSVVVCQRLWPQRVLGRFMAVLYCFTTGFPYDEVRGAYSRTHPSSRIDESLTHDESLLAIHC